MLLTAVVAIADNGVIGRAGGLPWHLPADLRHFKAMTMGRPVLMGRRTFESIGKALPGRRNLVLTRGRIDVPGIETVTSVDEAIARVGDVPELAVIGGAQLWEETLPRIGRLYLTRVHADVDGDTFFPPLDPIEWLEVERREQAADEKNAWPMTFVTLDRR